MQDEAPGRREASVEEFARKPEELLEALRGYRLSQMPLADIFAAYPDDRQREVLVDRRYDQDRALAYLVDAGADQLAEQLAKAEARIKADPAYVEITPDDPAWSSADDKRDWHLLTTREAMLQATIAAQIKRLEKETDASARMRIPGALA